VCTRTPLQRSFGAGREVLAQRPKLGEEPRVAAGCVWPACYADARARTRRSRPVHIACDARGASHTLQLRGEDAEPPVRVAAFEIAT
jgi:hypothetical protein